MPKIIGSKTFEDVSLKERGVELKRPIAILHHMLVQLQLAVTEGSVAAKTPPLKSIRETEKNRIRKIEDQRGSECERIAGELN